MKQALFNIDETKILFFDIEAASNKQEIEGEELELYGYKNRNRETDEILPTEEIITHYKKRAALNPLYGRVVCITVGMINGDSIRIKTFSGEEKEILTEFINLVNGLQDYLLSAWNIEYDLPYIRKRAVINKVDVFLADKRGNDAGERPWSVKGLLDLMQIWKGISFYSDSLEEVAFVLGLPSPKEKMKGSQVSEEYYKGNLSKIIEYNIDDVVTLINIFRTFVGRPPITEINIPKEKIKVERTPLLTKLFNGGTYTVDDEAKLKHIYSSLSAEEKPIAKALFETIVSKKGSFDKKHLNIILEHDDITKAG